MKFDITNAFLYTQRKFDLTTDTWGKQTSSIDKWSNEVRSNQDLSWEVWFKYNKVNLI